ncbi:Coenzyme F420 hydrogenase/dehydrogenase, beta subunit C-terminal domain [Micrococcus luteus]|uniref:Coenzyme F420 hydrogenase/dehydrogenase, beta subunit C-terminal domain n=1 Tax=Micrococcus luteus TaxID=1270 RepID=UPI00342E7A81
MPVMPGRRDPLRRDIDEVIRRDLCSGCGVCELISDRVTMTDQDGFRRPAVTGEAEVDVAERARRFASSCPGRVVLAQRPEGSSRDDFLGPITGAWSAWATDPAVRYAGSSGGTLTAIAQHLAAKGATVSSVAASPQNPRRTVPVQIMSREEALASAGSRYAPVSAGGRVAEGASVMVGKPCEASARRALDEATGEGSPVMLSFFCAGTPSQGATDALLEKNGIGREDVVDDLVYRGRGWPGDFYARAPDGRTVAVDYTTSWGRSLGPAVQWRCRLCVDGVGESADITAGDYWESDERGYPLFDDAAGRSALIARTARGLEIVQECIESGVLEVAPLDIDALLGVQRYQVERRKYLVGRLMGNRVTGGRNPRYRGFNLWWLVRRSPIRLFHEIRGTVARARRHRSS